MLEKKVIITMDFYNRLLDDMDNFNIAKEDNTSSENEFFSKIIIQTYNYQSQINKIEKIKNALIDSKNILGNNKIVSSILNCQSDNDFDKQLTNLALLISNASYSGERISSYEKKALFIRETKATENKIESIINENNQFPASEVLKGLLYDYMSYPLYTREQILFSNIYDTLLIYKKEKRVCKIHTSNGEFLFRVYDIIPGREEYHLYVVGYKGYKMMCFKLSTINYINDAKEGFCFTESEISEIKKRILEGPEWIGSEMVVNCQVQLDDKGIKRYWTFYKDRPKFTTYDKSSKIMTFNCSNTQLYNYFRSFGKHAIVLNNERIIKGYKTFYSEANEAYK